MLENPPPPNCGVAPTAMSSGLVQKVLAAASPIRSVLLVPSVIVLDRTPVGPLKTSFGPVPTTYRVTVAPAASAGLRYTSGICPSSDRFAGSFHGLVRSN